MANRQETSSVLTLMIYPHPRVLKLRGFIQYLKALCEDNALKSAKIAFNQAFTLELHYVK
jgi:hypothetical protein